MDVYFVQFLFEEVAQFFFMGLRLRQVMLELDDPFFYILIGHRDPGVSGKNSKLAPDAPSYLEAGCEG
jgi:hypothetical protein